MKNGLMTDEAGNKLWFLNGNLHREDGPALEFASGDKYWYLNGKRHREDGPAIEWANGDKRWFLDGKEYTDLNEYQAAVNLKAFW
jgi:hypothetical protein